MPNRQTTTEAQTFAVNLRVRSDIRTLIDRAAQAQGKTRSDFMIYAARRAAEESLLDQALVRVDVQTYEHFLEVLDRPPGGEARLHPRRLSQLRARRLPRGDRAHPRKGGDEAARITPGSAGILPAC